MSNRTIITAVQKMAGTFLKDNVLYAYGTVISVDDSNETCEVLLNTGEQQSLIPNVKLQAGIGDGLLLIPKEGSEVIVCYSSKDYVPPYIVLTSDIEFVYLVASNTITLNDGTYGGLVKVVDLVTKLNNIENDINKLKQAFLAWTPVPNDGGAALKTSLNATYPSTALTLTNRNDIENTKINHGS